VITFFIFFEGGCQWNKNSENKRFEDIKITKNQKQYIQIWIAPNIGFLNGSSVTKAVILIPDGHLRIPHLWPGQVAIGEIGFAGNCQTMMNVV